MKRITAAMAAHVDAGKTTLSEALLLAAGTIRCAGRVDNGDCFLDNDVRERSRGITIFSKQAILKTETAEFTLLDTPGHTDFSAETERAFTVADCAVLVISGTDGVQPHTETLWELLSRFGVPVFAFVNKTDISHRSKDELLADLRRLTPNFADFSEKIPETAAEYDEDCMNALLDSGDVPDALISRAIAKRHVFPVMFGSALKNVGVTEFLTLLEKYSTEGVRYGDFGALVYKISTDANGARLTHLKIMGGELKKRTVIDNSDEKVTQIRIYNGARFTTADTAKTGQIAAVTGLSKTFAGQALGKAEDRAAITEAPLKYRLILPEGTDPAAFFPRLKRLEEEEPLLKLSWRNGSIHAAVMGQIQLEILRSMISERFGVDVEFDEGAVSYRETIKNTVEGVGHYEPLRHYAEVHLILEPLPAGSGVVFARDCRDLGEDRQRLILSCLKERLHIGVLTGSPITDMKITLAAGRDHPKHTEGGDLAQAAWRALRQGLASAESVLLEPFYRFKLEVPTSSVGRAMTDLRRMGAEFSTPSGMDEYAVIEGRCPVSEMQSYSAEVMGYTHGTGRLSAAVEGYFPCHNADEVIEKTCYDFNADVENSADSIFCSHGAGVLVKWNEAPRKMHVPSVLGSKSREAVTQTEVSSYKKRIATDKELMEIFERTYGKINRKKRTAMRRDKSLEQNYKSHEPMGGTEYLLVDGYNMIFSWEELAEIARNNLDAARARLIDMMCNYRGFRKCNLILVFDAYKVKSDREIEQYGDVTVVYTKHAETADNYIERAAHTLAPKNRVRVATSDGTEQIIILGQGAFRVSAREFKLEVDEVMASIRKILEEM